MLQPDEGLSEGKAARVAAVVHHEEAEDDAAGEEDDGQEYPTAGEVTPQDAILSRSDGQEQSKSTPSAEETKSLSHCCQLPSTEEANIVRIKACLTFIRC